MLMFCNFILIFRVVEIENVSQQNVNYLLLHSHFEIIISEAEVLIVSRMLNFENLKHNYSKTERFKIKFYYLIS